MMLPDWLTVTFTTLPHFLWVYVVVGVPLALLFIPREDWHRRALVLMTAFALGPSLLTAWMLSLGSLPGAFLTRSNTSTGLMLFTVVVWLLAGAKAERTTPPERTLRCPLTPGETILVGVTALAVMVRFVVIAYWPFTAYDALWVYGFQGRLYFLENAIPATIDYYPQFIPLQYTYGQLAFGAINDSAARAVMPLLHVGGILAAYTLGAFNFNRRAGIFLAALWALYPAVGEWARMGDLEIPTAFLVTGALAYFFAAWREPTAKRARRYALLGGLIYGAALWTKPTAGGIALGIMLLNVVELGRVGWRAYRPRFVVSLVTALACAPLGGVWYLRNLAFGHNAVDFPPDYWYTLAERGGGQLLWYAAGLVVVVAYLTMRGKLKRLDMIGVVVVIMGIAPSALARFIPISPDAPILLLVPSLDGLPRMGLLEWGLVAAGLGLVGRAVWPLRREMTPDATLVGWMVLATLPYFALYFWRYSYHVRLSFALVPLMAVPIAVTLAAWVPNAAVRAWRGGRRWALAAALTAVAFPGLVLPLYDSFLGWNYLWSGELADDRAKRESGNEALMWMVDGFEIYERENGVPPVVVAPGVQRLPFFFPTADMRTEVAPTRLEQIADAVYYVESHPDGTQWYAGVPLAENQVWAALGRQDITRWAWGMDDGIFRYDIYELNIDARWERPTPIAPAGGDVRVGDYARLLGHDLGLNTFEIGQRRVMKLFWEVLEQPENDYMVYIHLRTPDGELMQAWDGPVGLQDNQRYYTTLVWEPGEFITDERGFRLTNEDVPPGEGYRLVVGMYDLATGVRVPITQGGERIGDGYDLGEEIIVIPRQE